MNWDKVKAAIGTIAPWLAGTLVSPFAGIAVQKLCDVFGLAPQSTPDQIASAIASASPAQLQALKDQDTSHKEFMAKIGYDSLDLFYKDRADARKREEVVKDNMPTILAMAAVIPFFVVLVLLMLGYQPAEAVRDGFFMVVGALLVTYKDVYGYYFGSSSGSHAKDDTIATMAGGK